MTSDKDKSFAEVENLQMFSKGDKRGVVACLAALLAALVFFYWDSLAGNRSLVFDASDYFYPWFFTVSESLRQWRLPLWNPFLFNGFPALANIQAQTFYPVNLLFLPFSSFTPYVVHLGIILHLFGAGVTMFFLSRRFTGERCSALLSALVYMFSGFMIGHFQHVTMIEVVAWFPLVFLFLDKALVEGRISWALCAGGFLGLSILAGHPQSSHAMAFILVVHALYRGMSSVQGQRGWRPFIVAISILLTCLLTSALLAAVQLLPTWELAGQATRGTPVSFELAARSGQFSLHDLATIFVPNYFGALTQPYWGGLDVSQSILYMGVVPLFLAVLAIVAGRNSTDVIYCGVLAFFSILLALGEHGPFFRFFYHFVPGFNFFRSPAHTVFIYPFFVALLAGYGLRYLRGKINVVAVFLVVVAVTGLGGLSYLIGPQPPLALAVEGARNINAGLIWFLGIAVVVSVVMCLGVYSRKLKIFACYALVVLTFADFYLHFSKAFTGGLNVGPAYHETMPHKISKVRLAEGLQTNTRPVVNLDESELQKGLFRIYTQPEGAMGTMPFGFSRAMLHRTFLVEGYEPLELARHRKLIDTLSKKNIENLLKITNSKYVSNAATGAIEMFPGFLPRTFIVPNARFVMDDERILEQLAGFDPRSTVVIAGKGNDFSGTQLSIEYGRAEIRHYASDRVEIMTRSAQDGYLVLSDTFYPGWTAVIDGMTTEVMRANYGFRAIFLPKGEHAVVFSYFPRYLWTGALISLVTILGLASLLVWHRLKASR